MFEATVKYFGSNNTWSRSFKTAVALYAYIDAVRPFICYSKVTDDENLLIIEKNYESRKESEE